MGGCSGGAGRAGIPGRRVAVINSERHAGFGTQTRVDQLARCHSGGGVNLRTQHL